MSGNVSNFAAKMKEKMRKIIVSLTLLLTTAVCFVSCLSNDTEEIELYSDCVITSFKITAAPIFKHTTSSKGEDSVYVAYGNDMSGYEFRIDHARGVIYNVDSLPLNTDPTRLLCQVQTKNNGVVYIQNADNDSVKYFTTVDSTDFTKPRCLHVVSSDYNSLRKYMVTVNIHQQDGDEFSWTRLADNAELAALDGLKTFAFGGKLVAVGNDGVRTVVYATAATDGNSWTKSGAALGAEAHRNVVVKNDSLIVLDGAALKVSVDGETFTEHALTTGIARLVAACKSEMYAIAATGEMLVSVDAGKTWTADVLDEDKALLPSNNIAYTNYSYKYDDGTEYVLLVGNRDEAVYAADHGTVVWRKVVETDRSSKWAYVAGADKALNLLPKLPSLSLCVYEGNVLASGSPTAAINDSTLYSRFIESRDGGISWKKNAKLTYPKGMAEGTTACAVAVDADSFIWIVAGGTGQVWRGRHNRLGWAE